MKSEIKMLIMLFLPLILSSCGESLLTDMGRLESDPVVSLPQVESFIAENTIYISWDEDGAADEYILWRALDNENLSWEQDYRGTNLSYVGQNIPNEERRLYSLSKVRGSEMFGPSDSVLGVGSNTRRDEHEPNDTLGTATELTYDLSSSLWFYMSYDGQECTDTDWYWVTVPPRRQANIVVTDNVNNDGHNYMEQYRDGEIVVDVVSGDSFAIENHSYVEAVIYFRITPNAQTFYDTLTLAGGSTITYDISLHSITTIN